MTKTNADSNIIPGTEPFPLAPETAGEAPTNPGRIAMARAAIQNARVEMLTNGGAFGLLRNKLGAAAEHVQAKGDRRIYKVAGVAIAAAGMPMAWALLNKGVHLEMDVFDATPQAQPSVLDMNQHHTTLVAETEPTHAAPKSDLHNVDIRDDEGSLDAARRMGMNHREATHFALSDAADAREARSELVKSGDAYWAEEKGGVIGWDHSHKISDEGMRAIRAYELAENHDGGAVPTPEVETPEKQPTGPVLSVEKALHNAQIPEGFDGKVHVGENGAGFIEVITPKGDSHRIDLPEGSLDEHGKLTTTGQEALRKGLAFLESEDVFGTKAEGKPAAPPKGKEVQSDNEISPDMWMAAGTVSAMGLTASFLIPDGIRRKYVSRHRQARRLRSRWEAGDRQEILNLLHGATRQRFARSFANRMPLKQGPLTRSRTMKQFYGIEKVSASVRKQLAKHELQFLPKDERAEVAQDLIQRLHAEMGIDAANGFYATDAKGEETLRPGMEPHFVDHVWAWTGQFRRGTVRRRRGRTRGRPLPVK